MHRDCGKRTLRDVGHGDTDQGDDSVRPEVAEGKGVREDVHTEGGCGGSDDGEAMFNLLGDGVLLCLQWVLFERTPVPPDLIFTKFPRVSPLVPASSVCQRGTLRSTPGPRWAAWCPPPSTLDPCPACRDQLVLLRYWV